MIAQLTFTQPSLSIASLSDEAERFLSTFQDKEDVTSLDIVLLAILRRDTRKVYSDDNVSSVIVM